MGGKVIGWQTGGRKIGVLAWRKEEFGREEAVIINMIILVLNKSSVKMD